MSNINKKSPSFQELTGVQDISHESAAAYSGGHIILYDRENYNGDFFSRQTGTHYTLGSFDNRASSYNVTSGSWDAHSGTYLSNPDWYHYSGNNGALRLIGAGRLNGQYNNSISSVKRVS